MSAKRILLCTPEGDVLFWGYSVAPPPPNEPNATEPPPPGASEPADEARPEREKSGIYLKARPAKTAT